MSASVGGRLELCSAAPAAKERELAGVAWGADRTLRTLAHARRESMAKGAAAVRFAGAIDREAGQRQVLDLTAAGEEWELGDGGVVARVR
jgi:hypothetical protein